MKHTRSLAVTACCLALALSGLSACQTGTGAPAGDPLGGLARLKDFTAERASSCDLNWENGNGDARPIAPGATLVIADLEGPGVITHLWNTVAAEDRNYSRMLVVRMYWDGEADPSVEAPLGDLFAMGHGKDQPFNSLPVTVSSEGRARNCYWPMPFRKSAKITVTNEGKGRVNAFYYYVDWQKHGKLPADTAYFHAQYRQEHPAVSGINYLIADIAGRGHYVGTVLSVRQHTASWWGEGDDFWFVDGEKEPGLRGTGSEDYFCDAWGLRQMATPYYGAPLMEGYDAFDRTTVYRWHITDPVPFKKSLRLEIEHKGVTFDEAGAIKSGFEERADDFSSVAFWYQQEPHKTFPPLAPAEKRVYMDWSALAQGESFLASAKASDGPVSLQEGGGWSGNGQMFWTPAQPNQWLEFTVDVPEAGDYHLVLVPTKSFDYGIFQAQFDGKNAGVPLDLYSSGITSAEETLALGRVEAGKHTLRFQNTGKNADSKGCFFGLDALLLVRQ